MTDQLTRAKDILRNLVAFPSVSGISNRPIADYIAAYLQDLGLTVQFDRSTDGTMANVFATIGPETDGGTILCGHMDVVPATVGGWTAPPFDLNERDGRLYGRGSVDMKGFLAMTLAAVPEMLAAKLERPIHIAFTYDEETCSYGAKHLVPFLEALPFRPNACIVGEPTCMTPYIGHKGGMEFVTEFRGKSGHSAIPANGLNTIYFAARFIEFLRQKARALAAKPFKNSDFIPPYTTINVGMIVGGEARNIVPDRCSVTWEMRPMPEDDGIAHLDDIKAFINDTLRPEMTAEYPEGDVVFLEEAIFPGLRADPDTPAQQLVETIWDVGPPEVVSFGTDGCFIQQAGIPTIVIGPGDIGRAHKPDEYIEVAEIAQGLEFMRRLTAHHSVAA